MPINRRKAHKLAKIELASIRKQLGIGPQLNNESMAGIFIEYKRRALEKKVTNLVSINEEAYPYSFWGKYVLGNLAVADHVVNALNEKHKLSLSKYEEKIVRKAFGTFFEPDFDKPKTQRDAFTQLHKLPNERGEKIRLAVSKEFFECYNHAVNANKLISDKTGPHPHDMFQNPIATNSQHFLRKLPDAISYFDRQIKRASKK